MTKKRITIENLTHEAAQRLAMAAGGEPVAVVMLAWSKSGHYQIASNVERIYQINVLGRVLEKMRADELAEATTAANGGG